jgi:lipopolysaccharide biosynthesis glycosyltransferase
MAHDIPEEELLWFRNKGILVKKCKPLHQGKASGIEYPEINPLEQKERIELRKRYRDAPVLLNKFELFTPEFKKWDTVLYLDCDIIVRYSLEALTKVKGFCAVSEYKKHTLRAELHPIDSNDQKFTELTTAYNLRAPAFNSGVMAFSTDIIEEDSFDKLYKLFQKYHKNCNLYGEQPIINLFFYKKWKKLNYTYNLFVPIWEDKYKIKPKSINATVLHFFALRKPWLHASPFYAEWKTNLDKAEGIDLAHRTPNIRTFGVMKILKNSPYVNNIKISFSSSSLRERIDCYIGLVGIFLKKYFPGVYIALKK